MGINRISETAVKTSVAGKATAARKAEGTARRTVSISKPGNKKKRGSIITTGSYPIS